MPRPRTSYYGDVSTALQRVLSPPEDVSEQTPEQASALIRDVGAPTDRARAEHRLGWYLRPAPPSLFAMARVCPVLGSVLQVSYRPTALVTGATAGIGREFARQLGARGHDLILVARDEERLRVTAAEFSAEFGADVETLRADLTDRADMARVAQRLADLDRPVDVLVNNAGFGVNHFFVGGSLDEELRQLDVLCTAVLVLSHAAAPAMKARRRGAIITVSSVSAFTTQATYSAAKAWATTFSEVLAGELRGSGVAVTAVHPGFTRTEFHDRAGMDMTRTPSFMWLRAETVVADALAGARASKRVVVPGIGYRAIAFLLAVLPRGTRWRIFWARPGGRRIGARR